jgi:restriction endonuclease S subunit
LLKSKAFIEENYRNGRGIVADLWTTRYDEMKMIKIPLPPFPEQVAIVKYLDAKTAKIDKAIEAEEKMIALLQERREIVINEAVGGGEDFNAEAQRGGERRGWEVRRLKSLLKKPLQYGANEAAEESDCSHPRYIRITDIDDSGKLREETFRSLPMEKAKPYILEKGDLLFARSGATAGKSFLFQEDYAACFAGYLIRASMTMAINPEYLFYFTQSGDYRQWKEAVFIQATIQNISAEKYCNLPIPLPPLPEQAVIVERLDRETGKIDRAIEVKRRQIALLRERREIIINEVVTGKVKVA